MNDLQMTRDGDLCLLEHDIVRTDSVEQGIFIRLRWWYGEWKFGPDYGVKYFEHVFVKNPNRTLITNDVRKQILSVDGVKSVDELAVELDYRARTALIRYRVTIADGERFQREVSIWENME